MNTGLLRLEYGKPVKKTKNQSNYSESNLILGHVITFFQKKIFTVLGNSPKNTFRQITIKDHGSNKPAFILTNNSDLALKHILEVYAQC